MHDPFPPTAVEAEADWAAELREQAGAGLADLELPTGREEEWRFTRTDRLTLDDLTTPAAEPRPERVEAAAALLGRHAVSIDAAVPVGADAPDGVQIAPLATAAAAPAHGDEFPDVFAALNAAHFGPGVAIDVDAGVRVEEPIVVVHVQPDGAASFDRTRVRLGEAAEASVIEIWVSDGSKPALAAPITDVHVGDAARFDYASVQHLDAATNYVGGARSHAGRDAYLSTVVANLGANVGRHTLDVELRGVGAECNALGIYVGDGDRNVDFRTLQHHESEHTTSRLLYRGAVWDEATAIYSGLIRIDPDAGRSDAHQASHYLILSEEANAASIPNLEIFNHDVKCGHATSGGPPDEDQIYYLASRGIAPDVAERLIVDGFFADLFALLPLVGVRDYVGAEVATRLADARRKAADTAEVA